MGIFGRIAGIYKANPNSFEDCYSDPPEYQLLDFYYKRKKAVQALALSMCQQRQWKFKCLQLLSL